MKNLGILILLISTCLKPFAQNFPGYRSGNYTGVNGVFFNPANIADSRYAWDVNLLGIHSGMANDNGSFKLKSIGQVFKNADSVLFGNSDKKTSGVSTMDILGPSVMFTLKNKTSIAFSTRFRTITSFSDIDGNFIQSINNSLNKPAPVAINNNGLQKIAINGWADFGVSLGRVLYSKGKHFIKGGVTLKYLAGSGNSYITIDQLKGSLDKDLKGNVYMSDASASVNIGHAGVDLDDFKSGDALKFNGSGIGGDIGFIYEYRDHPDQLNENSQNSYKLKIGIAVQDIGSLNYKPASKMINNYSLNVSNTQQWYPETVRGLSVSNIINNLNSSPYFTNNSSGSASYKVNLPTTLQLDADYQVKTHWYVEAAGQINLANKSNIYNAYYSNSFSITPRYEKKDFGIYLPLSYNEFSKFNAGIAFRFGPVYFGSGSIFTALFNNSKQGDIHFGVNIGSLLHLKKVKKQVEAPVQAPPVVEKIVTDTDKDGIPDEEDKCPTVAGVSKYNGCPIPDGDGDGINDEEDKCPTVSGIAKYNGCPVPDGDGDGINDEEDKCPTVAGVSKYNGCPIPDGDGDGVNDEEDKCPTLAGIAANQGCPAIKEETVKKITQAASHVYFVSGKATLLSKSYHPLNEVAKILKATPNTRLQIEGYTDNRGKPTANLALSNKRALAVKNYLVHKGVDQSRISYKGYGQKNPVASNKTAAGRAKNRRVKLKLEY